MKNFLPFLMMLLASSFLMAQEGGADCATAFDMGTLPVANTCIDLEGGTSPPVVGTYTTTLSGASASGITPIPSCNYTAQKDKWYQFTVPAAGTEGVIIGGNAITADSGCPGGADCPAFLFALYSGSCAGLSEVVGCDLLAYDNVSGPSYNIYSSTITGLIPGATYFVRIWDFHDSNSAMSFDVTALPPPPSNDACGSSTSLNTTPANQPQQGCNFGAGGDDWSAPTPVAPDGYAAGTCSGNSWNSMDNSVFYTFTLTEATAGVTVSVSGITCNGAAGGTAQLMLLSGNCVDAASSFLTCAAGSGTVTLMPPTDPMPAGDYTVVIDGNAGDNCVFDINTTNIPDAESLPIELSYFRGEVKSIGNLLKWGTLTERDNAFFQIMRSTNGFAFEAISRIEGQGTTFEAHSYTFLDDRAPATAYYKLKQVDFNGSVKFSDVIFLESELREISIFPMPVKNVVNLTLTMESPGDINIQLLDASGRLVRKIENNSFGVGVFTEAIDVQSLARGIYFLVVRYGEEMHVEKIVLD